MRRAGANPTDVEVTDIINKIDNETGAIDFQVSFMLIHFQQKLTVHISFQQFCTVMQERNKVGCKKDTWSKEAGKFHSKLSMFARMLI